MSAARSHRSQRGQVLACLLGATIVLASSPSIAAETFEADASPAETAPTALAEDEGAAQAEDEGTVLVGQNPSALPIASQVDPLTERLLAEVARYYRGIGVEPTDDEVDRGLQTLTFLLLDGVTLARITAAVDAALSLHSPGRRVPFEVAVPLRIQPSSSGAAPPAEAKTTPTDSSSSEKSSESPLSAEAVERRAERRRKKSAKRTRLRLYKQWKSRTRGKRMLLSVGIPLLASGYALGFATAGRMTWRNEFDNFFGDDTLPQSWAWVTSVPVVGTLLLGIWTEGIYPWFFALSVMQITGAAFTVGGILIKVDWPYDRDPTALRIGRTRRGEPALTLRAGPSGLGGWITGSF